MESWCSAQEVADRVAGQPPLELCQEYADQATSLLYMLSGRRFIGEATIESTHQVNRRGYIKLGMWSPVRDVLSVVIAGVAVPFALSPAGTYVTVAQHHAGAVATMVLEVGQAPPLAGRNAAASLGADLLRADSRYAALPGASDVRVDSRVKSITRQGVTYSYLDPTSLQDKDMTGVPDVDLFLRAVNPVGMRHQPKVVSSK